MKIRDPDERDSIMVTINFYKNCTVMAQGSVKHFQAVFSMLKTTASKERSSGQDNTRTNGEDGAQNTEQYSSQPTENQLTILKEHFTKPEF